MQTFEFRMVADEKNQSARNVLDIVQMTYGKNDL